MTLNALCHMFKLPHDGCGPHVPEIAHQDEEPAEAHQQAAVEHGGPRGISEGVAAAGGPAPVEREALHGDSSVRAMHEAQPLMRIGDRAAGQVHERNQAPEEAAKDC